MAGKSIPDLTAVTTPVEGDEFAAHQSGATEAVKYTKKQILNLASGEKLICAVDDDATAPTISLEPGSGFYAQADGVIRLAIDGALKYEFEATKLGGTSSNSPQLVQDGASATVPVFVTRGDTNTGQGRGATDAFSAIAGGVEAIRYTEATSILQAVEADVGLTAATDSIQGTGVILSSYNVYDTVAVAGDAATLPATFIVGTLVYVKNGAAANSMDVFPASGDDAGAGTDTVVAIAAGDFKVFLGTSASATWEQIMGGTA